MSGIVPEWMKAPLEKLLAEHKADPEEPLVAAVVYMEDDAPVVLEVIQGFAGSAVPEEREFIYVEFGSELGFEIPRGYWAKFRFTNPESLERAVHEQWKIAGVLHDAAMRGQFDIVEAPQSGTRVADVFERLGLSP